MLAPFLLAFSLAFAAAESGGPRVVLRGLDETRSGELLEIAADVIRIDSEGERREFAAQDSLSLEFENRPGREPRGAALVLLANGDRLFLRVESIDETHLAGRWAHGGGAVRVPLEAIRVVLLDPPRSAALRRALVARFEQRDEAGDLLILANGDRVAGEFQEFDGDSIEIETGGNPLRVPRAAVRGLGFDPELVSLPAGTGRRAIVALTDGSWITGGWHPWKAGPLRIDAEFGATVEFPREAVRSLRFLGGRAVHLSDLEPADYRHTPYLGGDDSGPPAWRLARDRTVTGGALMLRGVAYPKGLGMHSRSAVVYPLEGSFAAFQAVIGIDDAAEGGGHAAFAVEVDGKRVYESPPLTGRGDPVKVGPLDVTGAKRLALIVEYGERGDILDYADWVDAVLVRPPDEEPSD